MKNKLFLILLILFSLMSFSIAEQYYGDVEIFVENDGGVSIIGSTNYFKFNNISNSQHFTSKNGEFWILNITSDETFESFIFELNLPENSEINYIKTTPKFRIENENNRIKIIGIGENKPFTILVQYKIKSIPKSFSEKNMLLIIIIVFIISLLIAIIIGYRILHKLKINLSLKEEIEYLKKKAYSIKEKKFHYIRDKEKKELIKEKLPKIDLNKFTPRQQDIIKILQKTDKITQKELEEKMNIPKSSVSRNVQSLVIKGIIEKQQVGITNYISLKK